MERQLIMNCMECPHYKPAELVHDCDNSEEACPSTTREVVDVVIWLKNGAKVICTSIISIYISKYNIELRSHMDHEKRTYALNEIDVWRVIT